VSDQSAAVYDSPLDPKNGNDARAIAARMVNTGVSVLELGPATGRVTRLLREQGCRVVAVELDPAMRPYLEPHAESVIIGDIETLALDEVLDRRTFDYILAGDVLEHLRDPLTVLRTLRPYLSQGGSFVLSIPNIAHGSVRLLLLNGVFEYGDTGILDRTHLHFYTLATILDLCEGAGLEIGELSRVYHDAFVLPFANNAPQLDLPDALDTFKNAFAVDPEVSVVQYVLRASPRGREAEQYHAALKQQVAQRQPGGINVVTAVENVRVKLRQDSEAQAASLHSEIEELRRAATQARTTIESLTFYLNRYKRIKEKFLPPGSSRERLARAVALRFLARPQAPAAVGRVEKRSVGPGPGNEPAIVQGQIPAPSEWLSDPHTPPVVIVIPNWNKCSLLRKCLESIFAKTNYPHFRVCIYDQGSHDGSREYLESLGTRVDAILAPENVGFVTSNNVMIQRYSQWDVVFLNNDTEVTDGWLENMVATGAQSDNIGVVGCKLIYSDGRLQEAGSQVFRDGSARAYGKYENAYDLQFNQTREVDYCSAACLYVKRRVLDAVGYFDERYSPAYYEDTDLAFAARDAGFKVIYEPRSVVAHHEYGSSGAGASAMMEANRAKFVQKWREQLKRQPRSLWEAPSVGNREKVLILSAIVPAPDRSAGGLRAYEFIRLMARHYHVVLAHAGTYGLDEYVKPLERLGLTVFYPGYARAVHSPDLDLGAILLNNDFDLVICKLFSIAEQYLPVIRQYAPKATVVVDSYDVHFLRESREAETKNDSNLARIAANTKKRELDIYRRADYVFAITEDDKQSLLREDPSLSVGVVPLIYELPAAVVPREQRCDMFFVGGFSHTPNVDAVLYLHKEIAPLIRKRMPGVKIRIVGNAPPAEIVALGSSDFIVDGYVPNVTPFLDSMAISIAPLRFGSGMKGKIAEAMAYGVPVVTTGIGAEGLYLRDGVDAMIADNAEEFAQKVVDVYQNPKLWETLSENGRKRVSAEWSPDAVDERLMSILRELAVLRTSARSVQELSGVGRSE
jgi:GT2 family glycosyltransferase/SAM-dependent methyltransferase